MLIPIVNEQDEIIAYKEREEVTKEEIYRVSALWVMNEFGEILLAQRAATKSHSPNKRTLPVNGTVEKGEMYEENIIRETQEEIGVELSGHRLLLKELFGGDWIKFVAIFFVQLPKSAPFVFDETEIQDAKRVSVEEFEKRLETSPSDLVPSLPSIRKLVKEKIKEM